MDENAGNYQMNQPPMGQPPSQGENGMAIASMVLGIVAVVLSCCLYYVALPCGIVGLILGILYLKKKGPKRGMAIAGVVLSGVALLLAVVVLIGVIAGTAFFGTEYWKEYLENMQ